MTKNLVYLEDSTVLNLCVSNKGTTVCTTNIGVQAYLVLLYSSDNVFFLIN